MDLIIADGCHEDDVISFSSTGLAGFITKAIQGETDFDPTFEWRAKKAPAAGLLFGAYDFFMPQDDPGEQANLFFRTVQPYLPMMLALDLEPAGHEDQGGGWAAQPVGRNISNVMAYLDELCKLVKGKPLIYTYNGFLNRFLTGIDLSAYGLWVPDPSNYHPIIPPPWKDWTLFQYSWTGKVPGITGDVDLNRFRGDAADFIELHYCGAA